MCRRRRRRVATGRERRRRIRRTLRLKIFRAALRLRPRRFLRGGFITGILAIIISSLSYAAPGVHPRGPDTSNSWNRKVLAARGRFARVSGGAPPFSGDDAGRFPTAPLGPPPNFPAYATEFLIFLDRRRSIGLPPINFGPFGHGLDARQAVIEIDDRLRRGRSGRGVGGRDEDAHHFRNGRAWNKRRGDSGA